MPVKRDLIRDYLANVLRNEIQYPFLVSQPSGVFDTTSVTLPATALDDGSASLISVGIGRTFYEWGETIPIHFIHQHTLPEQRTEAVRRWIDQVHFALYRDRTLGGHVRQLELGPVSSSDEELEGAEDLVQATAELYIEWCSTDSRG